MKKITYTTLIVFILINLFSIKSNAQFWDQDVYGNIHNTNSGSVFINTTLKWSNGNSFLSNDQGGSIEMGHPFTPCTPFIDFHNGQHDAEDFNMRIINSGDYKLEFTTNNWNRSKIIFNGTPNGYYNIPSLKFYNNGHEGNSLQFQSAYGLAAIDFWNFGGLNGVIDFYADYQSNPTYCQFSIKSDNSCGWGNDWNWLSAQEGGSIHLNKAGLDINAKPFIDFTSGYSYMSDHIDIRIQNSAANTLDFWTDLFINGSGGTKVMSVKSDGIYAKKLTVQSSWSDFVFKNDYNLLSLTELENYIKENGHLPDIPTESYIEENGLNVGEMTTKLLQKIEELSLYIIDINKQIELLKEENEEMKTNLKNK
jgi:hypothetical protein